MPQWVRYTAKEGEVMVADPTNKTENVYLITLKGRYKYSLQDQIYIKIEDVKKRFNSSNASPDDRVIAASFWGRKKQLQTILAERGDEQLARRVVDWSMEYVERPDLPPLQNTECLICRVPRYRCSC